MKNKKIESYLDALFHQLWKEDENGVSMIYDLYTFNTELNDICDMREFSNELKEEVAVVAEFNLIESGNPALTETQLFESYHTVTYGLIVNSLVKTGHMTVNFNPKKGENEYTINKSYKGPIPKKKK